VTRLHPGPDRDRWSDAELILEAHARATQALVSAGMAIGLAACAASVLAGLAIDALIGWGMAAWLARLLGAAMLGLPALVLAKRAAAGFQRRSVMPLEALRMLLSEAGQPTHPKAGGGPTS
jgi:hypothetical protein